MTARLLVGDVFDRMAELDDGSVDLILTSPPFLALRSYLPADHPDKGKEIGSEATPAAFLDTLLALTGEWRRLLAPHGSICVELGDTYSGGETGGGGTRTNNLYNTSTRYSDEWNKGNTAGKPIEGVPVNAGNGWPLAKSLCGIPHLYHLSLAYGRNVLRAPLSASQLLTTFELILADMEHDAEVAGVPSPVTARDLLAMMRDSTTKHAEVGPTVEIEPWRVRNVVAWCRPNPPVGALGDKFRPGTSYMTVACVSGSRYFDLDAVRSVNNPDRMDEPGFNDARNGDDRTKGGRVGSVAGWNAAGAPPLDWWEIPTHPYPGAHYATWPPALCVRPILSMCPQRVCRVCGEPSRRIVDSERVRIADGMVDPPRLPPSRDDAVNGTAAVGIRNAIETTRTTTGWTDCGHNDWRNGLTLDPFAGSGTTLAVATGHGRDAVGIDLDPRSAELCAERVGMFLEVEEPDVAFDAALMDGDDAAWGEIEEPTTEGAA